MLSSTILRRVSKKSAAISQILTPQYDLIDREDDTLIASIHCASQLYDLSLKRMQIHSLQTFAVMWDGQGEDAHVYKAVEEALIMGVMSPVQIIHQSEGTLTVVLHPDTNLNDPAQFASTWQEIVNDSAWDEWILRIIYAEALYNPVLEGRILRNYGPTILAMETLGLGSYVNRYTRE